MVYYKSSENQGEIKTAAEIFGFGKTSIWMRNLWEIFAIFIKNLDGKRFLATFLRFLPLMDFHILYSYRKCCAQKNWNAGVADNKKRVDVGEFIGLVLRAAWICVKDQATLHGTEVERKRLDVEVKQMQKVGQVMQGIKKANT